MLLEKLALPQDVMDLLEGVLATNPRKRWDLKRLMESPLLKPGYKGLDNWVRPEQLPELLSLAVGVTQLSLEGWQMFNCKGPCDD